MNIALKVEVENRRLVIATNRKYCVKQSSKFLSDIKWYIEGVTQKPIPMDIRSLEPLREVISNLFIRYSIRGDIVLKFGQEVPSGCVDLPFELVDDYASRIGYVY